MAAPVGFSCLVSHCRLGRKLSFEKLEQRQLLAVTTLSPVADTYTRAGVNAGSADVLAVRDLVGGNDFMAYVRFDLSGLIIEELSSATLTFYKTPVPSPGRNDTIIPSRFEVYGLTDAAGNTPQNWNEATLAEGNLGAEYTNTGGESLDLGQVFNLDADAGANVFESVFDADGAAQSITGPDLITFLNGRVDDNGLVTFITLVDSGADDRGWGYGSRENADPGRRPTLELVFEGEPVPDPYPDTPTVFPRQMERLDRGVVAVRDTTSEVYVGWRILGNDPADVAFNLYRSANGGPAVKLNGAPLTQTTDFVDTTVNVAATNEYFVGPVINGVEQDPSESYTLTALAPVRQYLNVPLQIPDGGTVPDYQNPGQFLSYSYNANDASVGDLDGDGQYEIVLKWDPSNSQDVSIPGYTGNTIFDAYQLDGELMWRIDLGINIRAGAHYSPFIVYDLDGDGKAEVAMKTGPGTKDGLGHDVILPGDDPDADYRNSDGRITTGPEYLTIFNGETGAAMVTVPYEPARNDVTSWGDSWGNRSERHLAAVAYLDGVRPSLIFTRGYNGPASGFSMARTDVVAYNWRDGELTQLWHFKARLGQEDNINVEYIAQGNHNLSIADVDGDGFDEIIYGACAIDNDGTGLYSTGLGHGDAIHVSDMDPTNPGLEVFQPHESPSSYGPAGGEFRDAMTGELLFGIPSANDVGRGVAFDIDPNYPGYEMWATTNVGTRMIYSSQGQAIYETNNAFYNFGIWWDADPLRELLDGTTISKWHYEWTTPGRQNLVYAPSGLTSNNGTKATPSLSADILGDWREEVIWRRADNTALQIWTTTIPATTRLFTLMHDSQYREAIAWQNVAYNQPPHPSFFLGAGMETPPQPKIFFGGELEGDYNRDDQVDASDYTVWRNTLGSSTDLRADGDHDGIVGPGDYDVWKANFGAVPPAAASASFAFVQAAPATDVFTASTASDGDTANVLAVAERLELVGGSTGGGAPIQMSGIVLPLRQNGTLPAAKAGVHAHAESTSAGLTDRSLLLLLDAPGEDSSEPLAAARFHAGDENERVASTCEPLDAVFEQYDLHLAMLELTGRFGGGR